MVASVVVVGSPVVVGSIVVVVETVSVVISFSVEGQRWRKPTKNVLKAALSNGDDIYGSLMSELYNNVQTVE